MQYTIRQIPKKLDQALRRKAKSQNKSLNQIVIEELSASIGVEPHSKRKRNLSDIAGTWVDDEAMAAARQLHEQIDPELWK